MGGVPLASPLKGATVLVVEQEPRVRAAVTEALDMSGCVVVQVESPHDALSTLEERSDVQVVVADIDGADADNGLTFAHQVHQRWPAMGLVITSGHIRHLRPSDVPGDGTFMPRPLPVQAFLDAVSRAVCHTS
jgi:DNA-binding NtrC family response regulator